MARVKRGTTKNKRKSKILKLAKGFRNARSTKFKQAKQAVIRAGQHAFAHRRKKKRVFRKLWQVQISAGLKEHNISYSKFIDLVTKGKFGINRKMLSLLAREDIQCFDNAVSQITGNKIERKNAVEIIEETEEMVEEVAETEDMPETEKTSEEVMEEKK